jgi:'Paired box' domain
MTAPLSQDLRERIVRAAKGGSTMQQAARRFAVSASAAIKLMQRMRQTGSTAPAKIGATGPFVGEACGRPAGPCGEPAWDHTAGDQGARGPRLRRHSPEGLGIVRPIL